ncbi:MAG: ABC transporter permease [Bacteroidia bacterium]|nr:ABC transporter permease [Bacteroidia bacterium]
MNFEWFTAKRLLLGSGEKQNFSGPIVKIAVLAVALGMSVMLIAIMIVTGFKSEITNKVLGFGNHIRITNFDSNESFEESPITLNQGFKDTILQNKNVVHIQTYATKAGIVKAKKNIEGIVLKGVSTDFDWSYLEKNIQEGSALNINDSVKSNDIIISKKISDILNIELNEKITVYFIENTQRLSPRIRRFTVTGIFETGLADFDDVYAICDMKHIQKLNEWEPNQIGGYEVLLSSFNDIDEVGMDIYESIGYQYNSETAKELYPQIFNWLNLQNINVVIILALIILVAGINMIATMLILIFENTVNIGILKSLGASDKSIRKIFVIVAIGILGLGLLFGNIFGLGLGWIQSNYGIIKLPQESYYVSLVPINFSLKSILLLNLGTIIISFFMLLGPSFIIGKLSPAKTLRFD